MSHAITLPDIPTTLTAPTPEEEKATLMRISRARTTVASFCRFFGHLILKTQPIVAHPHHNVDTAAVSPDGTVYFNHQFVAKLSDPELCGLVIHETMHPALLCWRRQGNRKVIVQAPDEIVQLPDGTSKTVPGQKYTLWNVAHDLSFNPEIEEMATKCRAKGKIVLPKAAAVDPNFKGQSAEQIYDKLLEQIKENKKCKGGSGSCKPSPWGKEGPPGTNGGGIGDDLRPDLSRTDTGKKAAKGDKTAQQKIANDWRVSVVAAAIAHERKHGRGHLAAGFQKLVQELQENKVDWRDVLSQWIGEKGINLDFTMRRPSRRSESCGAYMPSYQRYGIDDVIVIWDTSGSMNGRETAILSEVNAICEDLGLVLRIICIDAQIHSDTHDVKSAIDMAGEIKGGGGSNFTPAFDLLEDEQYEGVVVAFTDGHIGVPATKPHLIKDVLWVLEPSDSKHSWGDQDPTNGAWGQVLYMED